MFASKHLLSITKVSFFRQCSKMQLIPLQNFIIKTCFIQFLWFFRLKCWFKCQIISRIHLSLPNAYKLMCFDRNINGNRDVKFFDWDYCSVHWPKKLTLVNVITKLGDFFSSLCGLGKKPRESTEIWLQLKIWIQLHCASVFLYTL